MKTKTEAEYMTKIMEDNRKQGCECEYTEDMYMNGKFKHATNCPSPMVENLPNVRLITEVLRVGNRSHNGR